MPKQARNDLTGEKFHRMQVLWFLPDSSKHAKFWCRCDCGVEKSVMAQSLIRGLTRSCGCYQKEGLNIRKIHGQAGAGRTPTYNSWASMMDRCEWGGNKPNYAGYGAIGIRVDPRWHNFENFLADMGSRPAGTSIDRINGKLGYFPGNCRWATRLEQALNRSNTIKVEYAGQVVPVYLLVRSLGLSPKAVRARATRRGGDYVAALQSMGVNVAMAAQSDIEPVYAQEVCV
jgi:hypothetical protein